MPTSARHSLPSPASSAVPDVPVDVKALADAVDAKLPWYTSTTPTATAGLVWRNATTGYTYMGDGASFKLVTAVPPVDYTPVVTMDTPNGTASGRYFKMGKDTWVEMNFTATAGVSLGLSAVTFTLPFVSANTPAFHAIGSGFWSASGLWYTVQVLAGANASTAEVFAISTSNHSLIKPGAAGFTFASGDFFRCNLRYEAATAF